MTSLFDKAKIIAEKVHANQVDKKGYPYMSHVIDIANRVSHLGESYQIVGLLHDAIEDAEPTSFRSEITKEIESTFDVEIINAIKAMTKVSGEDYFKSYLPRLKNDKIIYCSMILFYNQFNLKRLQYKTKGYTKYYL